MNDELLIKNAMELLREFVNGSPVRDKEGRCWYCATHWVDDVGSHFDECLWRRANELVKEVDGE